MAVEHKHYGSPICVRWDCLTCPLPVTVECYWSCAADCVHCHVRRLNRTWGNDLRPAEPDAIRRKLEAGLKNPSPKSSLAWALKRKKTLWLGRKSDPYQPVELQLKVARRIEKHLVALGWSFLLSSKYLASVERDEGVLAKAAAAGLLTVLSEISPGAELDWAVLERERTTPIEERLLLLSRWKRWGWNVGVNGEPFIPGYHTEAQFRDILRRLKACGLRSYNTYNVHLNDFVAKRLLEAGLDLERIWTLNQDQYWRPQQRRLCAIAEEEGMTLGCPDFVNVDPSWREQTNTCCGVNVSNPCRYNTHTWRRRLQRGKYTRDQILEKTWEGIGDQELGRKIMFGEPCDHYTMRDAGLCDI